MQLKTIDVLYVIILWTFGRMSIGQAKHYNDWKKCAILTLSIFVSLFLCAKIGLLPCIIFIMFTVFLISGRADIKTDDIEPQIDYKGNIKDITLFKNNGEPSKYQKLLDFITYNPVDENLLQYENFLRNRNEFTDEYLIYKYFFRDKLGFNYVKNRFNLDSYVLTKRLDEIYKTLEYVLKI